MEAESAYAWYDPLDGRLKHVTFIKDHVHPDGTEQLEIDRSTAEDILTGRSRLQDYQINVETNEIKIIRLDYITSMMKAMRLNNFEEQIPFDKKWQDADAWESPLRLLKTNYGFELNVVSLVSDATLYVTMKKDPSWLIKTVNINTMIKKHGLGPLPVEVPDGYDYSVYVRYHAA